VATPLGHHNFSNPHPSQKIMGFLDKFRKKKEESSKED
jgi:hypothetical protein